MEIPTNIKNNIKWIEERNKVKVSKFMLKVLSIMSKVYGGLHHTDAEVQWKGKDFTERRYIQYHETHRDFATFDFSELTTLVVLAHDEGIRISICGVRSGRRNNSGLYLCFGNRMGRREGSMNRIHPTLSQAIKRVRGN